MKKNKLSRLNKILEMPSEITSQIPRVTNLGFKKMMIENYKNILEYQDGNYVLTNPITEANIKAMRNNMDDSDLDGFDDFLQRNWGIKLKREDDFEEETPAEGTKKRGRKPKKTI